MCGAASLLRTTTTKLYAMCVRGTLRFCGDTTNRVEHLRFNHSTEHDVVTMMQQRSEEEKVLMG